MRHSRSTAEQDDQANGENRITSQRISQRQPYTPRPFLPPHAHGLASSRSTNPTPRTVCSSLPAWPSSSLAGLGRGYEESFLFEARLERAGGFLVVLDNDQSHEEV